MIPISDSTRSRTTPYVNVAIIAAAVGVFLYELTLSAVDVNRFFLDWGVIPKQLIDWLESRGARVHHLPLTRTLPPDDPAPLRQAVAHLSDFDWVALTSARAVSAVADAITAVRGLVAESDTAGPRWACVGSGTAAALRLTLGVEADLVPEELRAGGATY